MGDGKGKDRVKESEGPFTDEILEKLIAPVDNKEDALTALNAHVMHWLTSHGWAGPEEVKEKNRHIAECQKADQAAMVALCKERDAWKENAESLQPILKGRDTKWQEAEARASKYKADAERLAGALTALLNNHVQLVTSGDCGNWNVEGEAEVIATREALAAHDSLVGGE